MSFLLGAGHLESVPPAAAERLIRWPDTRGRGVLQALALRHGPHRRLQAMIHRILTAAIFLFPLSEIALGILKRSRRRSAERRDRGSIAFLWLAIALGVALGTAAMWVGSAELPFARSTLEPLALFLMVGGLSLRWYAILTLGRFFTVDVAIHSDHSVVQSGPYRFVRHPSYTGLMLAFFGLGVFLGNGLSILGILLPIILAIINRVVKEEEALSASLGAAYSSYCSRTKRFIPGVI